MWGDICDLISLLSLWLQAQYEHPHPETLNFFYLNLHTNCTWNFQTHPIVKEILHQKIFYRLNFRFWIVMGCGIARFGRRGLVIRRDLEGQRQMINHWSLLSVAPPLETPWRRPSKPHGAAPRNPCAAPRNPMAPCLETPGAPRLKTPGDKIWDQNFQV